MNQEAWLRYQLLREQETKEDLLEVLAAAEQALRHVGSLLHAERCRAAIAKATGTPATNPEAAAAFDKMMGSPAFPSIKGEQK